MTQRLIGPFNRVEGDLEVKIDIGGTEVREAWVSSPLYRGFEHILRGKSPLDALVYAPRICGICSVSQSVAAARALAEVMGVRPTGNGRLATDLILAAENVADHLTHFYMFFMPDFCRDIYAGEPWQPRAAQRFRAMKGDAATEFLQARAAFMHIFGIMAGKWPHSLALQPGGSSRAIEAQEQVRLLVILKSFRRFLERHVFGASLESFASLSCASELEAWQNDGGGDFRSFLVIADGLALKSLGRAGDRVMSYGSFGPPDLPLFRRGISGPGGWGPLDTSLIAEDVSHAWMQADDAARHPFDGVTLPDADQPQGYSWCKAPRLGGGVVEVGAFARQVIDGHPLALDLYAREGVNVRTRIIGRFIETARLVAAMDDWAGAIRPREPFNETATMPEEAEGAGFVEAARGALGHWLRVRKGHILNYQIVAPTTWNFSPRDKAGVPGALEQALVGAPVRRGETDPVSVQHVVRSFDPCMVCTVH
jgi:uptake hydrogenase large subunit